MIPYAYRSGTSLLHRCPAGIKLLGLLAVSAGAFFSAPGLGTAAAVVLTGALVAGIRPRELLRGSKPVLLLAVFFALIRGLRFGSPGLHPGSTGPAANLPVLSLEGLRGGLRQGLCFIVSFAAGALLFSVTTMQELRDSLGRFEGALADCFLALRYCFRAGKEKEGPRKRRTFGGFSLGLSLMLGFIPRFFEIWETANTAFDARAGKKGLRRLVVLVPLITERMMEMAGETAEALDSRGLSLML
jgi:energy-coupling factor transporter transmembrane protein EcfT